MKIIINKLLRACHKLVRRKGHRHIHKHQAWPAIIHRNQHPVSRKQFNQHALKVLYRLHKAGYEAYLVGGGVRDVLLGNTPKDFDVATNALPEEVRKLFSNCRLVGRRFRLAHIHFGRDIIEVATFRANTEQDSHHRVQADSGRLLRDNVYGNIEEDALRRDFTVNALYYNIADFSIVDYHNGMQDIQQKQLRMIGDPNVRYREDPVRMLRAIRFATKLAFNIDDATKQPIYALAELIKDIPPARLFDESLKLFMSGYSLENFKLLQHFGFIEFIYPQLQYAIQQKDGKQAETLAHLALNSTDQRIQQDKPVTPAFLFAAFLWHSVKAEAERLMQKSEQPIIPAYQQAMSNVLANQTNQVAIPKRFTLTMRDIWQLQLRLPMRQGKRAFTLLAHPKFRAAFDFLELRAQSGEIDHELVLWWQQFQQADSEQQRQMVNQLASAPKKNKRRKRRNPASNRKPT